MALTFGPVGAKNSFERLWAVRQHRLLSKEQLAVLFGVKLVELDKWVYDGLPVTSHDLLARLDAGATEWIITGNSPPAWLVFDALDHDLGLLDWKTVPLLTMVHTWKDVLHGRLHRALRVQDALLPIPKYLSVPRRAFLPDPSGSWTSRLTGDDLAQLATHLQCWPEDDFLRGKLLAEVPRPLARVPSGIRYPEHWAELLHQVDLHISVCTSRSNKSAAWKAAHQAISDAILPQRQHEKPNLADDEPELMGEAIRVVLSQALRASWAAEVLGPQRQYLATAIERILATTFARRSFLLSDLALEVERRTGLVMDSQDASITVSRDTLLSHLNAIAKRPGSALSLFEKTWSMDLKSELWPTQS